MKRSTLITGALLIAVSAGAVAAQQAAPAAPADRPAEGRFALIDTDGDEKLSQAELRAHAAQRLTAADADGDGLVTVDEMVAHMEAREEERRALRRQRMAERMLERADDDGDGALSVDEMLPPERTQTRMFERLDADGDGMLSEAEFARMGRGHGKGDRGGHRDGRAERHGGWHGGGHGGGHGDWHGHRDDGMDRPFGFEHRDGGRFLQNAPDN